jgi:site-specific recombinase XerD
MPGELTIPDPERALTPYRPDTDPALVYLASLPSEKSRRVMAHSLTTIARLITDNERATHTDVTWESFRYPYVKALQNRLIEQYSPASVNRIMAALRGVLKECRRLGLMSYEDYSQAVDFKPVKGERLPAGRDLSYREIKALIETCTTDPKRAKGARDAAMVAILYTCGLRRSELARLEIGDFDAETGRLLVHGKGRKERRVYVKNRARYLLDQWLIWRGMEDGALFLPLTKHGKVMHRGAITDQTVFDAMHTRGAEAGIADFSPHDFRRTLAGDLLDKGVDLATVAAILGHADVNTTRRYDRRGERAKEAAQALIDVPA